MVMSSLKTQKNRDTLVKRSNITNFYRNRSVLITGGTGFVGKVLIEKLLRTCAGIATIFVLIRPKRDKHPQERLQELFACKLFDIVRQQDEGLLSKVIAVDGDIEEVNLRLSDADLTRIRQQVSVVFNVAATVRFNEPLKKAVRTNIISLRNVVEVCRSISKLSAFVHVSTAYVNFELKNVDERIYPVDMKPDEIIKLSELLDDDQMDTLEAKLIKNLPNTYVYTKKQAELFLLTNANDLPIVICRPSIITSTWREPFSGWIDNLNTTTGLILGQGLGFLRTVFAKDDSFSSLVPVDKVAAMIISLGWFISLRVGQQNVTYHALALRSGEEDSSKFVKSSAKNSNSHKLTIKSISARHEMSHVGKEKDAQYSRIVQLDQSRIISKVPFIFTDNVPIFHCTISPSNSITWKHLALLSMKFWLRYPSISTLQYPTIPNTGSLKLNKLYLFILQILPAYLADMWAVIRLKRTSYVKKAKNLKSKIEIMEPFSKTSWFFETQNDAFLTEQLMSEEDKLLFGCNLAELDWNEYIENYVRGIREFMLKESEQTLEEGRIRMRKLYIIDRLFWMLGLFLVSIITYFLSSKVLSQN